MISASLHKQAAWAAGLDRFVFVTDIVLVIAYSVATRRQPNSP